MKFASVSVITTCVAQGLLFLTYDVMSFKSAIACNIIATTIATIPAYWLNRTWTWGKRGKSDMWREVAPFWIIAFIGLVLSTVAVGLAASHADSLFRSHFDRKLFVNVANLSTYALIWIGRYFFFNKFLFGQEAHSPGNTQQAPADSTVSAGVESPGAGVTATAR